jgi:hypothetical protein
LVATTKLRETDSAKVRCGKCRMAQKKTQLKKSANLKIKLVADENIMFL